MADLEHITIDGTRYDITDSVLSNEAGGLAGNSISSSEDVLDYFDTNYTEIGTYFCSSVSGASNTPESSTPFTYIVMVHSTTQSTVLAFRPGSSPAIYQIKKQSGTWGSWLRVDPGNTDISSIGSTVTAAISKLGTSLTDGSVTKVGTATVGSGTTPMYLNSGTPTASTADVGSSAKPVYMKSGTVTECDTSLDDLSDRIDQNATDITTNKDDADKKYSELNSALAEVQSDASRAYKTFGRSTVSAGSVTFDSAARVTLAFTYPSEMTNHSFVEPISVDSGNGYIQGTFAGIFSTSCNMVFHDCRGTSTSTITPTIYYIYGDK